MYPFYSEFDADSENTTFKAYFNNLGDMPVVIGGPNSRPGQFYSETVILQYAYIVKRHLLTIGAG